MEIKQGQKVGGKTAKRRVRVTAGKGRLSGRSCIRVDLASSDPKPRSARRGVKLSHTQFRGCYTSKAEAEKKARALATVATLPKGKGKRARKRSRK